MPQENSELDQKSPENVVRLYWKQTSKESEESLVRSLDRFAVQPLFDLKLREHMKARYQGFLVRERSKTGFKIVKVDYQSPTSVSITAKEPEGVAWTTLFEEKQYRLVKINETWFIEDILTQCFLCQGTGEVYDMKRNLAELKGHGLKCVLEYKRKCSSCKGKGKISCFYFEINNVG